ncbi:MAG: ABC transporter permease [Anaerolineales bacterium]|nr:ABC transporter permease [Anaerolineales bacterium]
MTRYIAKRLLILPLLLLIVSLLIFFMINLAPGDPVSAMISPELPSSLAQVRKEALGLNKPIMVRYILWLGELFRGNLGYSLVDNEAVAQKILGRLSATIMLMGSGLSLALLFGIPLGIYAAVKHYSISDYALTVGAFAAVSIPHFFLGLLLLFVFSLKLGIFPVGGMYDIGADHSPTQLIWHLILPAIVLSLEQLAIYMRLVRSSLLEIMGADYIRTARSKGLTEQLIVGRHALRNGLLPVLTRLGFSFRWVFSGAVVTEQVFTWPGIGLLTIRALEARDYPVIMGINLIAAVLVVIGNLIADIMYAIADPRIRYE